MKEISLSLGFRTFKAQQVFKNGIDHHRSCQVLEVCLTALTKELMVPYIRFCHEIEVVPSAEDYIQWFSSNIQNQNYAYLYHVTFSYLLAFNDNSWTKIPTGRYFSTPFSS